jgi:hypothetical protein
MGNQKSDATYENLFLKLLATSRPSILILVAELTE